MHPQAHLHYPAVNTMSLVTRFLAFAALLALANADSIQPGMPTYEVHCTAHQSDNQSAG